MANNTRHQNQSLELTLENFNVIIENANGFRDLAHISFHKSVDDMIYADSVTMFNMHTALELILKALRLIATGEIDKKHHQLKIAYQKPELSKHLSNLESLYKEVISEYENQQNNVNRKIAKNSTEEKEYHPSSLLKTLKTIDSMDCYVQRYSHEKKDNWILQKDFQFLFHLFNKICLYVEEDFNKFSAKFKWELGEVLGRNPDGTISRAIILTGLDSEESLENQRKTDALMELFDNGMIGFTIRAKTAAKRRKDKEIES